LIHVANHLGWKTFHAIGHSMSGQFLQYLALKHPARIESLIAITPVPPSGAPIPPEIYANIEAAARGDATITQGIMHWITAGRMGTGFVNFKARRWYETSTQEARLAYLKLFTGSDFSEQAKGLATRMLIIAGEHDLSYSAEHLKHSIQSIYPNSSVEVVPLASHYPMQETPPYLVGLWERFLE
ncbi:MAG TPA: alpha/beta hydrolase, partial [Opitutales bacterium]|nr:alpha/beta hydrolase [Opitutales bacterium]